MVGPCRTLGPGCGPLVLRASGASAGRPAPIRGLPPGGRLGQGVAAPPWPPGCGNRWPPDQPGPSTRHHAAWGEPGWGSAGSDRRISPRELVRPTVGPGAEVSAEGGIELRLKEGPRASLGWASVSVSSQPRSPQLAFPQAGFDAGSGRRRQWAVQALGGSRKPGEPRGGAAAAGQPYLGTSG